MFFSAIFFARINYCIILFFPPMNKQVKLVVGIDEAGRGPLAGPVVACALTIMPELGVKSLRLQGVAHSSKLKDSKKLNPKQREQIYGVLKNTEGVQWATGRVSERMIDKINIFKATKLAMIKAVRNLEKKISQPAELLLIDGNFGLDLPMAQKSIIRGDEKIFLIKLASIVAKVERDCLMMRWHKKYPQYGFDRHKGYGTKIHLATLAQLGPCKIHRISFRPVKMATMSCKNRDFLLVYRHN